MWRGRVCRCQSKEWSSTLLLPHTSLPMRADAHQREPGLQKHCMDELYTWQRNRPSAPEWNLHDGPPYANGRLHMGHLLNKTLKDVINRYKVMTGHRVRYVPGWDCHGLPIELKALQQRDKGDPHSLEPVRIRRAARKVASEAIAEQRAQFMRWGVMADWDQVYTTMDPEYESAELGVFLHLVEKKMVYQALKPVHWSPSSQTALAESELEYPEGHVSAATYVALPVMDWSACPNPPQLPPTTHDRPPTVAAVIWTTTPWTIVANRAVCVHPRLKYVLAKPQAASSPSPIRVRSPTRPDDMMHIDLLMVASDLLEELSSRIEGGLQVVCEVDGADLVGAQCAHPLFDRLSPILAGDHVTATSGTGMVHTAPGHGADDYIVCKAHGIPPFCPVDYRGRFTDEAGETLKGLSVLSEGNEAVMGMVADSGHLLAREKYSHKYPYDWRTKKPVIQRATLQWFIDLSPIQQPALDAVSSVTMIPDQGRARLHAAVGTRKEWCISRQRSWGLPVPVFYRRDTREALMNQETVEHLQSLIRVHGSDCWWDMSEEELLPPSLKPVAHEYVKGTDTLDVWFDSGVSWQAVLNNERYQFGCVGEAVNDGTVKADVYVEGSDQHRGWFQSSLLTRAAVDGQAPYERVMTHGFVLDGTGRKMSKSLGNVIDPDTIVTGPQKGQTGGKGGGKGKGKRGAMGQIPAYGVDVLRLWVAQSDTAMDAWLGADVLKSTSDALRKIRNTARFMLGNLHDFNPADDLVEYQQLRETDRYMLHTLATTADTVTDHYERFAFHRASQAIQNLVNGPLSSLYFEIVKDRLYADQKSSLSRRGAQTVLHHALDFLVKMIAPVVPHTAEDIHYHNPWATTVSSFHDGWVRVPDAWRQPSLATEWAGILQIRDETNRMVERLRSDKVIKSSSEVAVCLGISARELGRVVSRLDADHELARVMLVAQCEVQIHGSLENREGPGEVLSEHLVEIGGDKSTVVPVRLRLHRTNMTKCPRCWLHAVDPEGKDELCGRCETVMEHLPSPSG